MLPDGHPYEGDCLARSERGILICATLQKKINKKQKNKQKKDILEQVCILLKLAMK